MRIWLFLGAVNGALAVGLGAIGAHGLDSALPDALRGVFETAVRYQFIHALALIAVAALTPHFPRGAGGRRLIAVGIAFTLGIALFCGGLYALAGFGIAGGARIAPAGGILLIAGWIALAVTALAKPLGGR